MNSPKKIKTVLVSGGAHFLGSHLCEALLINGFKVICLDDFSLTSDKNLNNCKKNKNFEIVKFSLVYKIIYTPKEIRHDNLLTSKTPR